MATSIYPRDLIGYGSTPPDAKWPGGAQLAVQFVVNVEEGGENCILHGDTDSESVLTDLPGFEGALVSKGQRNLLVESVYEYGSRVGFWRIMNLFASTGVKFTAFAIGMALERNPEAGRAMAEAGHEVACHGYRWINYSEVDEPTERDHIRKAVDAITASCGTRPLGWFVGRGSRRSRKFGCRRGRIFVRLR